MIFPSIFDRIRHKNARLCTASVDKELQNRSQGESAAGLIEVDSMGTKRRRRHILRAVCRVCLYTA